MTIEERLDAVETLISQARSVHVDEVNAKELKEAMGREAYVLLQGAFTESRANGTFEQHRDRLHTLSTTVLHDVFEEPPWTIKEDA